MIPRTTGRGGRSRRRTLTAFSAVGAATAVGLAGAPAPAQAAPAAPAPAAKVKPMDPPLRTVVPLPKHAPPGPGAQTRTRANPGGIVPQSRDVTHTVRAGDTVWALAREHNTTVQAIISANGLNSDALIRIGETLSIPRSSGSSTSGDSASNGTSSGGSSSSSSGGEATTHTVSAGETLSHLALRYQTSVQEISAANNLSGSLILVGQTLRIPGGSAPTDLVPSTFLHRTYPEDVVAAANQNKQTLLSMDVPGRDAMQQMVRQTAADMGVDPALALAVAHQESGFDARAVSPANAVGTMQVIPSSGVWAGQLVGRELNLLDPQDNVTAGVAILRALQRTSDDLPTAIASYYQGQGSVRSNGMFEDTERYVANVQALMDRFG